MILWLSFVLNRKHRHYYRCRKRRSPDRRFLQFAVVPKVHIAVYTATEGFDWQPGSVYGKAELEKYHAMIGRFPDILMDVVPYGGVFVCDGRVVFYRYHVFEKGDSRGRDALYCVLGTLSLDEMRKVDLAQIFASRQFSRPHKPFPTELDVEEHAAERREPKTFEELEQGLRFLRSAGDIGYYATFFPDGKFFCRMNGDRDRPQLDLDYAGSCLKPAVVAVSQSETPPLTSSRQERPDRSRSEGKATVPRPRQNAAVWILSGLLVLALVALGAVLLMASDTETEQKADLRPVCDQPGTQADTLTATNGKVNVGGTLSSGGPAEPMAAGGQTQALAAATGGLKVAEHSEPDAAKPNDTVGRVVTSVSETGESSTLPPVREMSQECQACKGSRFVFEEYEEVQSGTNWIACAVCCGKGQIQCLKCGGSGQTTEDLAAAVRKVPCRLCQTNGWIKCLKCDGRGGENRPWIKKEKKKTRVCCGNCSGKGEVTVRQKLCPACQGTKTVRACPNCIKGAKGLNHHEMRDGKFVLCDATGCQIAPDACPICHGLQEVGNCETCGNKGYVDVVSAQGEKEVRK